MNAVIEEVNAPSPLDVCTVVVIYDDLSARARAMTACDYLVKQFWENVELKFHWWRADFLGDSGLARVAANNAVESDFLIVCVGERRADSPTLEAWFENWIGRRSGREGALLDLSANNRQTGFLREICVRGNFDYLAPAPFAQSSPRPTGSQGANSAPEMKDRRSNPRPPSHFGLNE